jgi:hypothetical protein
MGEAVELLRAAFLDVVGVDLAEDPTVEYVHRLEFAHGGIERTFVSLAEDRNGSRVACRAPVRTSGQTWP